MYELFCHSVSNSPILLQEMPSIVVDAKGPPPPRGQAAPAPAAAASFKVSVEPIP